MKGFLGDIGERKSIAHLSVHIPEGMKAETILVQQKQVPRYYRMGNGIKNTFMKGEGMEPIDAIDAMAEMTAQELWVVQVVKDNLILIDVLNTKGYMQKKTSCRSVVRSSELSNSEKQRFKAGFKRLSTKGLLKRIKREHYILNPNFLIPHFYEDEVRLFESIKKKGKH